MKLEILRPRSLQQRTLFFILVPIFSLLLIMSFGGYVFMSRLLLNQWGETAIAKLQRTAHLVDMQLRQPKDLLNLLQSNEIAEIKSEFLLKVLGEIRKAEGVSAVEVEWPDKNQSLSPSARTMPHSMGTMGHYSTQGIEVSPPKYNNQLNDRTVSLISELYDKNNENVGRIQVVISFDTLIASVINTAWWKSNKAYLIDHQGNVLARTTTHNEDNDETGTFGTTHGLEFDTFQSLKLKSSGMVFGDGSPPKEVSGFYRLMEAPWTMVVIAPGEEIMQPIIRFKLLYIFSFFICITIILFVIRIMTGQVTSKIKDITVAANDLSVGHFGDPLKVTSRDEVGELTQCFNSMSKQLHQRLEMKEAIDIAREVQQSLLPKSGYCNNGISINGVSLYCDEIGGDYYDIIAFPDNDKKVAVVVGDVVGHGIGAALLMTTVRALLRSHITLNDNLGEVVSAVNRLLCEDTQEAGNFVTLFCMVIDKNTHNIKWVRAGHDAAIVYDYLRADFSELKGPGLALGVERDWQYRSNDLAISDKGHLILVGSDGAWEVENPEGQQFGKKRIRELMATNNSANTDVIVENIIQSITEFKAGKSQKDDITLTLVKC